MLFARAIKISEHIIKDTETVIKFWVLCTLSHNNALQGWPRSTCILENSDGEQTTIDAHTYDDVQSLLPLGISNPSSSPSAGNDWFTLIPVEPFSHSQVFEPWSPNGWGDDLNWADYAIVDAEIEQTLLALHDWDLVPEFVFNTPNIKGLKQTPDESSGS
jgi:hypothetical protein